MIRYTNKIYYYYYFFFLVNMGYIKAKPQSQGLCNYKSGYKIDQKVLASAVGTTPLQKSR